MMNKQTKESYGKCRNILKNTVIEKMDVCRVENETFIY